MPPGPGGVAIAAMVSSVLPAEGVCSAELKIRLLFISAALPLPGRSLSAFSGAVDQYFLKQALAHASAADILIILQGDVNNPSLVRVQRWN